MLTWLTDMRNHRSYDIPFFDDVSDPDISSHAIYCTNILTISHSPNIQDPCFPKKDIGHDEVQLSLQPITYPTLAYSGPIAP